MPYEWLLSFLRLGNSDLCGFKGKSRSRNEVLYGWLVFFGVGTPCFVALKGNQREDHHGGGSPKKRHTHLLCNHLGQAKCVSADETRGTHRRTP